MHLLEPGSKLVLVWFGRKLVARWVRLRFCILDEFDNFVLAKTNWISPFVKLVKS